MERVATKELLVRQRKFFDSHQTLNVEFRLEKLQKLIDAVNKNEAKIFAALKSAPFLRLA